jgi:CheY-like chemotaxis protein
MVTGDWLRAKLTPLKVLVLHGDEAVRSRVISHLQNLGSFDTRHFAGGRDARQACRAFYPDIVIVDTSVLDVTTSELIERLRPSVRRQRLVLTSAASTASHAGPLRRKPDAVLWSPFSRWEFQQAVQDQVAALGQVSRAS